MTPGVADDAVKLPLRIACYGYAGANDGSVSSAGYVVLRELLERGHRIDLFGKKSFAHPFGLESYPNLRFIDVEERVERTLGRLAGMGPRPWRRVVGGFLARQTARNVSQAIKAEHARQDYTVQLFLGTWSFGRVRGLPTVSWIQGPPGTDGRSISRHARDLIRLCGIPRYVVLRIYAAYRETFGLPPFKHSDVVVCGSNWAAEALRSYLPAGTVVETLAYPVDLNAFSPGSMPGKEQPHEVLWLGRSVPRKRLDLFLLACEQLILSGRNIQVRVVVSGFGFAPGYRQFLANFPYPDRLIVVDSVPRSEVPELLRRATVLVQPSEDENFGSAVAEALACGTPVVLGPTNGTGDYVGDGGVIFSRYDASAVAAAVATVLDGVAADPTAWPARARTAANTAFDVGILVDRLESIVRRAIVNMPRLVA